MTWFSTASFCSLFVGQVSNLQRVFNPLGPSRTSRRALAKTGAQDAILPHIQKQIMPSRH
jgi:hypothetical protein